MMSVAIVLFGVFLALYPVIALIILGIGGLIYGSTLFIICGAIGVTWLVIWCAKN